MVGLERLDGLSKLEDILFELDINSVILAFRKADRGDFFDIINLCHEYRVKPKNSS